MGSLTLPAAGAVYVDANVVIYSVEKVEPYYTALQPLWAAAQASSISLISSELLLLETLVKPLQQADRVSEAGYRALLLASNELRLMPITMPILDSAARLRATTGLRTPDAIHAATALLAGCVLFATNDTGFTRVAGLPVVILRDVVLSP